MWHNESPRRLASQRRRSDLRFAGLVSAGMIATVVVLAVLLAPVLAWNGSPGPNARERDQTIHLRKPDTRAPTPAVPSADRAASHIAANAAGRIVATGTTRTATDRPAAGLTGRLGVTQRVPQAQGPRGDAPRAGASFDTDGDGLPDTWERRYGLDPENAADATADPDGDGLDNLTELRVRTAPNGADSDHNGVRDGDEDTDNDGAVNLSEQQAGTDPGSGEDVPPVAETENDPGPAVTEDDTGVEDDGGAGGDIPAPPTPEHPDDGQGEPEVTPVPAPDNPAPDNPVPPAPDPTPPADDGGGGTALPPSTDQSPDPSPTPATAPETAPTPPASDPAPIEAAPTPAAAPGPAAAPAPTPTGDGGDPGSGWGHADQGGHGSHFAD